MPEDMAGSSSAAPAGDGAGAGSQKVGRAGSGLFTGDVQLSRHDLKSKDADRLSGSSAQRTDSQDLRPSPASSRIAHSGAPSRSPRSNTSVQRTDSRDLRPSPASARISHSGAPSRSPRSASSARYYYEKRGSTSERSQPESEGSRGGNSTHSSRTESRERGPGDRHKGHQCTHGGPSHPPHHNSQQQQHHGGRPPHGSQHQQQSGHHGSHRDHHHRDGGRWRGGGGGGGGRNRRRDGRQPMPEEASRDRFWYFSRDELERIPSYVSGCTKEKELEYRIAGTTLIEQVGHRGLRLKNNFFRTIATALVLFHRYCTVKSIKEFNVLESATACLFIAYKVEDAEVRPQQIRVFARLFCEYCHRRAPTEMEFEGSRARILEAEFDILLSLNFDVHIVHPIVEFNKVMKKLQTLFNREDVNKRMYELSRCFLNDSVRTPICVMYEPRVVAHTCVFMAWKFITTTSSARVKLPPDAVQLLTSMSPTWTREMEMSDLNVLEEASAALKGAVEEFSRISRAKSARRNQANPGNAAARPVQQLQHTQQQHASSHRQQPPPPPPPADRQQPPPPPPPVATPSAPSAPATKTTSGPAGGQPAPETDKPKAMPSTIERTTVSSEEKRETQPKQERDPDAQERRSGDLDRERRVQAGKRSLEERETDAVQSAEEHAKKRRVAEDASSGSIVTPVL